LDGRVEIDYDAMRDRETPNLRVTWTPEPGTKRSPGEKIMARATAHDDANRWQTGIESIDFIVMPQSNNQFFGFHQWPQGPQRCENVPPPRTAAAVYTVPADPPPIIKLAVCTKDFVPHELCELAEFPTGDFHGTLTDTGGPPPHKVTMSADFVLNHDGKGNLTGTMVGETRFVDASTAPGCFSSTRRPHRFRIALVGSYTEGRSIKVFLDRIDETPMVVNTRCPTYNDDVEATRLGFRNYLWYAREFLGTPSPFGDGELLPDGTRLYKWEGPPQRTVTVTLRRARN
jgi:hypothetical protein